jgi:hypothetical protein
MAKNSTKKLRFDRFAITSPGVFFMTLCVIIGIGAFLAHRHQITQTAGVSARVHELFALCANKKDRNFSYECMREGLQDMTSAQTLLPVMESLEALFLQSNEQIQSVGIFTCHPLGHMVGEIAIKKGMVFADVVRTCDRKCDFGCTHGAFVGELRKNSSFLSNITALCEQFENSDAQREMASCAHAVGHGLSEVISGDIARVLSYCDQMHGEGARHACGQGAIMDNLVGLPDRPREVVLTQEDLMNFCSGLPGAYKKECFDASGMYASKISKDEKAAQTFCDDVPNDSRLPCVYSLGSVVYFLFRHEAVSMREYCMSFEKDLQMSCLQGAIDTSVGESDPFSYGRSLCEALTGDARIECFSFLGDRLRWAQGNVQADTACSALLPADAQVCRVPYEHP